MMLPRPSASSILQPRQGYDLRVQIQLNIAMARCTALLLLLSVLGVVSAQNDCYISPYIRAGSSIIPCGGTQGISSCCQAGDICLSDSACWNPTYNVTYLYGCSDPTYKSTVCPYKCGAEFADAPYVGLDYCSNTTNNEWSCTHPPANSDAIEPFAQQDCYGDSKVAFAGPSSLQPILSLPTNPLASKVYFSEVNPTSFSLVSGYTPKTINVIAPSVPTTVEYVSSSTFISTSSSSPATSSTVSGPISTSNSPTAATQISTSKPTSTSSQTITPIAVSTPGSHATLSPSSSSMSSGTTIGIGVGVAVGLCAILLLISLFVWRRRQRRNQNSGPKPKDSDSERSSNYISASYLDQDSRRESCGFVQKAELAAPERTVRAHNRDLSGSTLGNTMSTYSELDVPNSPGQFNPGGNNRLSAPSPIYPPHEGLSEAGGECLVEMKGDTGAYELP